MFSEEWDYWLIDEYQTARQVHLLKIDRSRPRFLVETLNRVFICFEEPVQGFQSGGVLMTERQGLHLQKTVNYRSDPALLYFSTIFSRLGSQFKNGSRSSAFIRKSRV